MREDLYEAMRDHQNEFWWYVVRCEILCDHIKKLPLKNNAKVLEIGCGTGPNIAMLKNLFSDVSACEYDEFARNYAREKFGIDVKRAELPHDLPYQENQFDLILLCDVLEHIEDDTKALEVIKSKLKVGGYLLITVPAHPFLWSYADIINHHFRRYTRVSLQKVVDATRFANIYERYFMQALFVPAALVRLIKNRIYKKSIKEVGGEKISFDEQSKSAFVNFVFKIIFRIEKYIVIKNLPGLSILKIVQKKS